MLYVKNKCQDCKNKNICRFINDYERVEERLSSVYFPGGEGEVDINICAASTPTITVTCDFYAPKSAPLPRGAIASCDEFTQI